MADFEMQSHLIKVTYALMRGDVESEEAGIREVRFAISTHTPVECLEALYSLSEALDDYERFGTSGRLLIEVAEEITIRALRAVDPSHEAWSQFVDRVKNVAAGDPWDGEAAQAAQAFHSALESHFKRDQAVVGTQKTAEAITPTQENAQTPPQDGVQANLNGASTEVTGAGVPPETPKPKPPSKSDLRTDVLQLLSERGERISIVEATATAGLRILTRDLIGLLNHNSWRRHLDRICGISLGLCKSVATLEIDEAADTSFGALIALTSSERFADPKRHDSTAIGGLILCAIEAYIARDKTILDRVPASKEILAEGYQKSQGVGKNQKLRPKLASLAVKAGVRLNIIPKDRDNFTLGFEGIPQPRMRRVDVHTPAGTAIMSYDAIATSMLYHRVRNDRKVGSEALAPSEVRKIPVKREEAKL